MTGVTDESPTATKERIVDSLKHYHLMIQAYYTTTVGRGILGKITIKREYGAYLQFLECVDHTLSNLCWIIDSRPDVIGDCIHRAIAHVTNSRLYTEGKLDKLSDLAIAYDNLSIAYNTAVEESHIEQC